MIHRIKCRRSKIKEKSRSMRTYTFGYSRLKKAKGEGFLVREDGSIFITGNPGMSVIVPEPLNGVDESCRWGRLILEAELRDDSILIIYAETDGDGEKMSIGPFTNQTEILLCELNGRFLKLRLEVKNGEGCVIRNLRVENYDTEILQMMPEFYQERGSVLHRYLSIYQSVYTDFQKRYESLGEQMDIRTCSVEMLSLMEQWLGMPDTDYLLSEDIRRALLMRASRLVKIRGTRQAVMETAKLLAGEFPQIIESDDRTVTIVFHREVSEELELQLLYILKWFLPGECRAHIVSWQDPMGLDEYCALDINAALKVWSLGTLDREEAMDQCVLG